MKNLILKIAVWAVLSISVNTFSQNIFVESEVTPELIVNGKDVSFTIDIDNATNFEVASGQVQINLPVGIFYVINSSSESTSIGITASGTTSSPVFSFSNLGVNEKLTFSIQLEAECEAIAEQQAGSIFRNEVILTSSVENVTHNSDAYNILYPSLTILSVSPKNPSVSSGGQYTQAITIINGGNGKVSDFLVEYILPAELQIVSSTFGTINGSQILLTAADLIALGKTDGFLDQDESIVLNVTLSGISCNDKTVLSRIKTGWTGSSGYCQNSQTNSNVSIDFADPNIVLSANPMLNTCFGEAVSTQELIVTNNGSGVAADLQVNIFKSSGAAYDQDLLSSFDLSTLKYKVGIVGAFTNISPISSQNTRSDGVYACLNTNPKGQFLLGLPNLEPGQSIYIQWDMKTCCPTTCNAPRIGGWAADVSYSDACAVGNYTKNIIGQEPFGASAAVFTESEPDINDGEEGLFTYIFDAHSNNFPEELGANYVVTFDLPEGLDFESNNKITWNSSATFWSPSSVDFNATTRVLTATFALPVPFNLVKSEIGLKLRANCSNTTAGTKSIDFNLAYNVNPSCANSCLIPLICDQQLSTVLRCPSGVCDAGVAFQSFEMQRVSFGAPDNDDNGLADGSGSLDFSKIKTNRIMVGDTLEASYKGVIHTNANYTSWSKAYVESIVPYGNNLTPIEAKVRFYDVSTSTEYVGFTRVSRVNSTNSSTFKVDLSPAQMQATGNANFTGLVYQENDTLEVTLNYRVSGNIGAKIQEVTTSNFFYTSVVSNPLTSSQKFGCNDFLENITFIGYEFSIVRQDYITATSCSQDIKQMFRLSIGDCCSNFDGGNLFPFEYRNWSNILEGKVIIPDFYTVTNVRFRQIRTAGTNKSVTQNVNGIVADAMLGDTLYFDLSQYYKNQGGIVELSDDGFTGELIITVAPNCDVPNMTYQDIVWKYNFDKTSYLNAGTSGWMASAPDRIRYNPSLINLSSSNPIEDGINKYVVWNVTARNPFGNQILNNAFLYFNSPTGDVDVVKVIDQSSGNELVVVNDLYLINSLPAGQSKTYQVYGRYSACTPELLYARAGYACDVLPSDYASFTCPTSAIALKVEPKPTQMQVQIKGQTIGGDCSPFTEIEVQFASVQLGALDSIKLSVQMPASGSIEYVSSTGEKLYPSGGSWTAFSNPVITSNSYAVWLAEVDTTFRDNALPGVTNTSLNKFKLRFQLETMPNFVPGDFVTISVNGERVCNEDLPQINVAFDPSIKFVKTEIPGLTGASGDSWSVSWADYNQDGNEDIFVTDYSASTPNSLYTNNGDGTFTAYNQAPIATDVASSLSSTWGDIDNDGDLDLFVANNLGSNNFLYTNNGDGTFTKITAGEIVNYDGYSHGASWGDYNGDGYLDLFVADFMETKHNLLYKNNGDATFSRDLTAEVVLTPGKYIGPSWADIDGDRDLDLFIPNYGKENSLYRNLGNGHFELLTSSVVMQRQGNATGGSWADVDNDGDLDLFVTYASNEVNEFFLNNGDGTFVAQSGILTGQNADSHGSTFADFNNDGWIDLFVTNDGDSKNNFYVNVGDGTFMESESDLSQDLENSFGTASGDVDNDGDADLFVANHSGEFNTLYLNQKGSCKSTACVNLIGVESNGSGIGAKIFVTAEVNGTLITQMREVSAQTGGGTGGQNSMKQLFGLGDASIIDTIRVEWPSGITQILTNQPINNCLTITETSGSLICGFAYNDANQNCVQDVGENVVANQRIYLAEKDMTLVTDSTGKYHIYLEDGTFTLSPQNITNWTSTCAQQTVTVTGNGTNTFCGFDFGYSAACANPDIELAMGVPAIRRGFANDLIINVTNIGGSELALGTLTLTLPSGVTAEFSHAAWVSYADNQVEWRISNLDVNETAKIILRDSLDLSIQTGDELTLGLSFTTLETECNTANNTISNIETVVGAIDPNEKHVHPKNNNFGYTYAGQELNYKILFENEGTFYATNVIVIDTIDEGLDMSTISQVISSHDFTLEKVGRVLTFRFRNIMLPAKDEDANRSQGFIQFKIKPRRDVFEAYEVHNTASIFFDFEEPIQTNTVSSKMTFRTSFSSKELFSGVDLFPLPVSEELTLEVQEEDDLIVGMKISDITGRLLFEKQDINQSSYKYNKTTDITGIYFLEVHTKNGYVFQQKILFE